MDVITIIVCIVVAVVVGVAAFFLGVTYRRKVAEAEIMSAEDEAKRLVSDAIKAAESKKKKLWWKPRMRFTRCVPRRKKEVKDRRSEVQRQERRINQKEENLDRKLGKLRKKEEALQKKIQDATSPGRGRRSQKAPV